MVRSVRSSRKKATAAPQTKRMYARVDVKQPIRIGGVGTLKLRNLSFDGALVAATAAHKRRLVLGAIVTAELTVPRSRTIALIAGVVRHDPAGVAVVWNAPDPDDARRLAELCKGLQAPAAPQPRGRAKVKGRRTAR